MFMIASNIYVVSFFTISYPQIRLRHELHGYSVHEGHITPCPSSHGTTNATLGMRFLLHSVQGVFGWLQAEGWRCG